LADHGESFGEHGEKGHGLYLWNTTMNIPFVISPPKPLDQGIIVDQYAVSGVDVFPTALSMLGIVPPTSDGRDLSPLFQDKPIEDTPVYLESVLAQQRFGYHPEIATVYKGWKLIDTPSAHLLHLTEDPSELRNVFTENNTNITPLRAFGQQIWNTEGITSQVQQSSGVQAQLAALGYMSNDFATTSNLDIKDHQETVQRIEELRKRRPTEENPASLIPEYETIIAKEPQLSEVRMGLGALYAKLGQKEKALEVYQQALLLEPNSNMIKMNMANTLGGLKRFEEGLAILEDALEKVPTDVSLQSSYLKMLMDTKQVEKAILKGEAWVSQNPNPDIKALLGIALFRHKSIEQAMPLLLESLEDGIPREMVHETIANAFRIRGDIPKAIAFFQKEHERFPNPLLLGKIGSLHAQEKQWRKASTSFAGYFKAFPSQNAHRHSYAQVLFNIKEYAQAETVLKPLLNRESPTPRALLLQANIMAKTGRIEEGKVLFEKAKALRDRQSPQ
ncbi:MAG: hypothetical protein CL916_00685, partial [Deltaproteobacteria bacterium]|nr:hypothetical protein [Deltaproteobacteria bacterium]